LTATIRTRFGTHEWYPRAIRNINGLHTDKPVTWQELSKLVALQA
jgi:hypothetical protein